MKNFTIIVLVGLFLFDSAGFYLLVEENINAVREEIRAYFVSEELVTLIIPLHDADQPTWTEKDEFSYKGEMYDVKESRNVNAAIVYTCYHDKKEGRLLSQLFRQIKNNQHRRNSGNGARVLHAPIDKYFSGSLYYYAGEGLVAVLSYQPYIIPSGLFSIHVPYPPPNIS